VISDVQAIFVERIVLFLSSSPSFPFSHNSKVSLKKLFATRPHGIAGRSEESGYLLILNF